MAPLFIWGAAAGVVLAVVSLPVLLTVSGGIAATVVAVLGGKATVSAVKIGIAGDGLETLNKLRAYDEVEDKDGVLVLEK